MPAAGEMDLSREEQSFFEAGDAFDDSHAAETRTPHRHRSRRRSRSSSFSRRLRRAIRRGSWLKTTVGVVLMIGAVGVGYWASMAVINRSLPDSADFGVEARHR
jgi:hypothetical protein